MIFSSKEKVTKKIKDDFFPKNYIEKKCVYSHSIDGEIFYIGVGTHNRPFATCNENYSHRSKIWQSFVHDREYQINILRWFGNKSKAHQFEVKLIRKYSPICNQVHNQNKTKIINSMTISSLVRSTGMDHLHFCKKSGRWFLSDGGFSPDGHYLTQFMSDQIGNIKII